MERTLIAAEAHLATFASEGIRTLPATSNPGPLGLFSFGLTGLLLNCIQTTMVPADAIGIVYGFAFFFGGLCQLLAGLLEYKRKNTLAMVAFISYGGFWISFAFAGTMHLAGIYPASVKGNQMMLSVWGIYTTILWLCTFSTNLIFSATFLTLAMLFFFLAGGQTNANFMKFAGAWGILVASLAWYLATAMLLTDLYGKSVLPLFPFKPINHISGGTIGTRRRVDDPEEGKA